MKPTRSVILDLGYPEGRWAGYDAIVELPVVDPISSRPYWLFRSHGWTQRGAVSALRQSLSRFGFVDVPLPSPIDKEPER